jgi:hypothetical protein
VGAGLAHTLLHTDFGPGRHLADVCPRAHHRFGDAAGRSAAIAIGKCDGHAGSSSLSHTHSPDAASTRDVDIFRGNADSATRGDANTAAKLADAAAPSPAYCAGYRRAHGDTDSGPYAVVHANFYFYTVSVAGADADRLSHADAHSDSYNDRHSYHHINPHALVSEGGKIKATSLRPPGLKTSVQTT